MNKNTNGVISHHH